MPVITIRLGKGRPIDKKRAFAEAVKRQSRKTLVSKCAELKWVTLLIDRARYDHENWATGGELHAEQVRSRLPPGRTLTIGCIRSQGLK